MTLGRRAFETDLFVDLKLPETKNSLLDPVVGLLFSKGKDTQNNCSVTGFSGTA